MPAFRDNLYLGGAVLTPTDSDDVPSGFGVGPMGRVYLWDTVPLVLLLNNIATAQTPLAAGALTLNATPGAGVTKTTNARRETVWRLDVPRAVSLGLVVGGTPRAYTVLGYDVYGQKMSEVITTIAAATVNGLKAFKDVLSVIGAGGGSITNVVVGTSDVLGIPVRVTDVAYVASVKWNATLAADAGTFVPAVTTDPATNVLGDVRGTYVPSSATDGSKRLVMLIGIPAIGSGPNATRVGAYGVTQDLGTT